MPHEEHALRAGALKPDTLLTEDALAFLFLLRAATAILYQHCPSVRPSVRRLLRCIVLALGPNPADTLMQRLFEPVVLASHADLRRPMIPQGRAWLLRIFDTARVRPTQSEPLIEAITIAVLYDPDHNRSFDDHARAMIIAVHPPASPAYYSPASPAYYSPASPDYYSPTSPAYFPTSPARHDSLDCIPSTPPYATEALKPGTRVVVTKAVEPENLGRIGVIVEDDEPSSNHFLLSCTDTGAETLLLIPRIHVEPCH